MSIVGTRPPLISETNLYEPRHKVKNVEDYSFLSWSKKVMTTGAEENTSFAAHNAYIRSCREQARAASDLLMFKK